jgi:hypothetical protein
MTLPIAGTAALWLAVLFGFVFGVLLHRGRVTEYDVIVNQFRLRDFTVLKVMCTAILVGGMGVLALHELWGVSYHVKSADMLGVILGAAIFAVGMVVYGYCPGTGVAAVATGSVHALVGFAGMLAGGVLYAISFEWVRTHVLTVWSLGKVRLPDVTGVPDRFWFLLLAAIAVVGFWAIETRGGPDLAAQPQSTPDPKPAAAAAAATRPNSPSAAPVGLK